jgi:hypothetical protein
MRGRRSGFSTSGKGLCGNDWIVHGGLIATFLNESLGRVVRPSLLFPPLPRKTKWTYSCGRNGTVIGYCEIAGNDKLPRESQRHRQTVARV